MLWCVSLKLILADEPTTALDVTIQAQMLGLINDLQKRLNTAMILVTHDLGVVAQTCERWRSCIQRDSGDRSGRAYFRRKISSSIYKRTV